MDVADTDFGNFACKNSTTKLTEGYAKYFGRILKKNDIEGKHTNKGVVYRIVKL